MLHKLKLFILPISLISIISVGSASLPDGYTITPISEYGDLKTNLENTDLESVLHKNNVKINKIDSAYQKYSGDLLHALVADVSVDNRIEKCCFLALQSPHGAFFVNCGQCKYESCTCY